jgi:uncharacterized protein (TIGR03435 family)
MGAVKTFMGSLAINLSRILERPVIDKTGLTGEFDFTLRWAPEEAADLAAPSLFTGLQRQPGLRLKSQRGPAEILRSTGLKSLLVIERQ